jgi:competence protein ComGC
MHVMLSTVPVIPKDHKGLTLVLLVLLLLVRVLVVVVTCGQLARQRANMRASRLEKP